MLLSRTVGFLLGALVLLVGVEVRAEAPRSLSKEQCFAKNEDAQDARRAGRLRVAGSLFRECTAAICPAAIREDCLRGIEDVRRATPTMVLVVKDAEDRLIAGANVRVDGVLVVRAEGAVIEADPGEHVVEVSAEGYSPTKTTVLLVEGAKGRDVPMVLTRSVEHVVVAPRPPPPTREMPPPVSNTQRTVSWIVMGAGLVGLGVSGATAWAASSAHDDALAACPGYRCSPGSDGLGRERSAETFGTISTISFVAGAALLVGGVVLFFTAPKAGTSTALAER